MSKPNTVTAQDAPFPDEHQERRTTTGEILHILWIPETTTELQTAVQK